MDNKLAEFYNLVSKKSKITKGEADQAAQLLYAWFQTTNDISTVCAELVGAYHTVTEKFAMKYLAVLSKQEMTDLCREFAQAIAQNAKASKSVLSCGFTLLAVAHKEKLFDGDMLDLLNKLVVCAEQKGLFSDAKCKDFKKNLLDATKGKFLEADYSIWDAEQLARLDAYLSATLPDLSTVAYSACIHKWREVYGIAVPQIQPVSVSQTSEKVIYAITSEMVAELQTLYQNAFIKNNAFRELEDAIAAKEHVLTNLHSQTQVLVEQNRQLENEIQEKALQVQDLDERLRNVFKWEDGSRKQELVTLKKDIASALKLPYGDYQALTSVPLSDDSYMFAQATLTQVFRILKRYGIEL